MENATGGKRANRKSARAQSNERRYVTEREKDRNYERTREADAGRYIRDQIFENILFREKYRSSKFVSLGSPSILPVRSSSF